MTPFDLAVGLAIVVAIVFGFKAGLVLGLRRASALCAAPLDAG